MSTYIIMSAIVLFLICELVVGAKYQLESGHFFDLDNTNAMRGFWCIIVILVHIPAAYQNPIQDMIGSFAYIGVTFFFMTSAYGLSLAQKKNPNSINSFWRRRLPKLLIPCFVVNLVGLLFNVIAKQPISLIDLVRINGWVQWLLVCYLVFWLCHKFIVGHQDLLTCVLVIMYSVLIYTLKACGVIENTTWCTEIYGFVWGIILFYIKDKIIVFCRNSWMIKGTMLCLAAGVVGIAYLKVKTTPFLGDYVLKIILGLVIISFMLLLNTRINIGNKVSAYLGNISFEIYLLHHTVFGFVSILIPDLLSGYFIMLSIFGTVTLSIVAHKCSNYMEKLFKENKTCLKKRN